jgi:hypothetical protein
MLKNLDLSNNDIEYFEEDLFLYNSELLVIWMSNNKISKIHSKVFDNLKNLNTLQLESNSCVNVKAYQSRSAVLSLVEKVNLQCGSADENKSKPSCYAPDSEFIHLNCNFKQKSGYTIIDKMYACEILSSLTITKPNAIVYRVFGNYTDQMKSIDVTGFISESAGPLYIPKDLHLFFPNLKGILIKHGRVKEIHQSDIKFLTKLEYLNLDENDIEVLETDLFKFNAALKVIWFYNNKLKSVDLQVMRTLPNLQDVDFRPSCSEIRCETKSSVAQCLDRISEKCPAGNVKLEQQIKTKDEDVKALKSQLLTLASEKSNLNQELSSLKSQNSKLNQDLREAQNSIEKQDKNLKNAKTEIKDLRQELNRVTKSSIESNNNTLDDLQSETLMSNFVMFIVLPLVCLITLINIVVYVSCCVFKTETEIDDKKAIVEEPGVNRRAWMNQIREDFDKF